MPYHSNIRWLRLGKVFLRVWDLREETGTFLVTVCNASDLAKFQDPDWMIDFAFRVDVMGHLNDLNMKLQGKNVFIHRLYSYV